MPRYNFNQQLNQRLVNQLLYYAKSSPQMKQQQSLPYLLLRTLNPNIASNMNTNRSGQNVKNLQMSSNNRSRQSNYSHKSYNQSIKMQSNMNKSKNTAVATPCNTAQTNWNIDVTDTNRKVPSPFFQTQNACVFSKIESWKNNTCFPWDSINCVGDHIRWNKNEPEKILLDSGKRYLVSFAINLFLEQLSIGAEFATVYLHLNDDDLFAFYGYGGNGVNPYTSVSTFCGTYLVCTPANKTSALSLRLEAATTYSVDSAYMNIVEF